MNCAKSAVGSMNSNKNKLNSEIIYNFNLHPNAHIVANQTHLSSLKSPKSLTFSWPPSLFMHSSKQNIPRSNNGSITPYEEGPIFEA